MGIKYEKEYEVHYYEVDYRLDCTITSIINFLCDIGTRQSEELGVGIDYLTKQNLAWVFYKYDINVKRYPKYGEKLRIVTEPKGFKKFYASRVYEIYNETDEKIVDAEAIFLLIDTNRRRAVRVPDEVFDDYGINKNSNEDIKIVKLEKLINPMYSKEFVVRYSDIDSNNHVNNSKYLEWGLESIPFDIITKYRLVDISVVFEKECAYGSVIKTSCEINEEQNRNLNILHRIEDEEGKGLTTLVSKWQLIEKTSERF